MKAICRLCCQAWARALEWFGADGKYGGRFGGGIVSFKLLYPLLDKFGMSDLGLQLQLHTDEPPSFGQSATAAN